MMSSNSGRELAEPLVTIAIPVYNRAKLVGRTLQSALQQNFDELEIIVVDNCSDDGTWEALQGFSNSRLRILRNTSNLGMFGNFNRCLDLARGKYVRILCSDDYLLPGCIAREVQLMESNSDVVLLSSRGSAVAENDYELYPIGHHLQPGIYAGEQAIVNILWINAYYGYNPLNFPSGILFRRDIAVRVGKFDEKFRSAADFDLWLKMLRHGNLAASPIPACKVMCHEGQGLARLTLEAEPMAELFQIARRHSMLLRQNQVYGRVLEQLSGRSLWLAWCLWRTKHFRGAQLHWQLCTHNGISRSLAFIGFLRHFGVWSRNRLFGTRLSLTQPQPFSQS